MINISFEDDELHDTCVNLQRAEQKYGSVHAAALVTFISDAIAFENVGELLDFLEADVRVSADDSVSVSIGTDLRAVLVVVGKRFVRDDKERVIWSSVTRLKLMDILRAP